MEREWSIQLGGWVGGGFLMVISRDGDNLSLFANNKVTSEDFRPRF